MNVNSELQQLKNITGLPVYPDLYEGDEESYIVYTYNDERPVFWGDDIPIEDEVTVQVSLYTPHGYNYMALKHTIRDYLESLGVINDISSWIDTYTSKTNLEQKVRHTTFNVTITKER